MRISKKKSPIAKRARMIAANNILNALFMVLSAVFYPVYDLGDQPDDVPGPGPRQV